MRLLLVEDDPMIGKSLQQGLTQFRIVADWVTNGHDAGLAAVHDVYDLMLLDLGLPGISGLELLRSLRDGGNRLPVVIVTARDAVSDRIDGLNSGADDYVIKPFDLQELIARMHAVLRRHGGYASPQLSYGAIELDPVRHEVRLSGQPVELSGREFALLQALMQRPGEVLSRSRLEDALYGWDEEVCSNAVEVHIHNLRRKLGNGSILNVRGVGYRVGRI